MLKFGLEESCLCYQWHIFSNQGTRFRKQISNFKTFHFCLGFMQVLNALVAVRKSTSSKRDSTSLAIIILFSCLGLSLFLSLVLHVTEFWTEKPRSQGACDTGITRLIKPAIPGGTTTLFSNLCYIEWCGIV